MLSHPLLKIVPAGAAIVTEVPVAAMAVVTVKPMELYSTALAPAAVVDSTGADTPETDEAPAGAARPYTR
jgi:hypothetical protein